MNENIDGNRRKKKTEDRMKGEVINVKSEKKN